MSVVSLGLEGITPDNWTYLAKSFVRVGSRPDPRRCKGLGHYRHYSDRSGEKPEGPGGAAASRRLRFSARFEEHTVITALMMVSISEVRVEGF